MTLVLDTGTVSGGAFGGITFTLYDVSTPVPTLTAGGSGLTAVYDDLGSGVPYSDPIQIDSGSSNVDESIPLLPAGVAAVEASRGGFLAIGGEPTGLGGNFAFSGTDVSGASLIIEFSAAPAVPILSPVALVLLIGTMIGVTLAVRRAPTSGPSAAA